MNLKMGALFLLVSQINKIFKKCMLNKCHLVFILYFKRIAQFFNEENIFSGDFILVWINGNLHHRLGI